MSSLGTNTGLNQTTIEKLIELVERQQTTILNLCDTVDNLIAVLISPQKTVGGTLPPSMPPKAYNIVCFYDDVRIETDVFITDEQRLEISERAQNRGSHSDIIADSNGYPLLYRATLATY